MHVEVLPDRPTPWRYEDGKVMDANDNMIWLEPSADDPTDPETPMGEVLVRVVNAYALLLGAVQAYRSRYGERETWPEEERHVLERAEVAIRAAQVEH